MQRVNLLLSGVLVCAFLTQSASQAAVLADLSLDSKPGPTEYVYTKKTKEGRFEIIHCKDKGRTAPFCEPMDAAFERHQLEFGATSTYDHLRLMMPDWELGAAGLALGLVGASISLPVTLTVAGAVLGIAALTKGYEYYHDKRVAEKLVKGQVVKDSSRALDHILDYATIARSNDDARKQNAAAAAR